MLCIGYAEEFPGSAEKRAASRDAHAGHPELAADPK